MANRPPRLERIFQEYQAPLWFVTLNTHRRRLLLDNVRQNPVRAGLANAPEEWPYQGELNRLYFD